MDNADLGGGNVKTWDLRGGFHGADHTVRGDAVADHVLSERCGEGAGDADLGAGGWGGGCHGGGGAGC